MLYFFFSIIGLLSHCLFHDQIAVDEKESILASLPADKKEKGLEIYTSLTEGKVTCKKLIYPFHK